MLRWESVPSPAQWYLHWKNREANIWPRATWACPVFLRTPPPLPAKGTLSAKLWSQCPLYMQDHLFVSVEEFSFWWALSLYFYLVHGVCMSGHMHIEVLGNWFFPFYHVSPGNWIEIIMSMCPSPLSHHVSPMIYFSSVSCSPAKLFWPPTNGLFLISWNKHVLDLPGNASEVGTYVSPLHSVSREVKEDLVWTCLRSSTG